MSTEHEMSLESLIEPIEKPVPGERLFRGDLDDWENNACPHWYNDGLNWSLMAEGYLKAGNRLVEAVVARDEMADEMLYPVCFAYRQFLELQLKETILLGNLIGSGKWDTKDGHDLSGLWTSAQQVLREHVAGMSESELAVIGAQIEEFHNVDVSGEEFRYPKTLKKKHMPARATLPDARHINLRHMRDVIGKIANLLNGAITLLWERADPMPIESSSKDDLIDVGVVERSRKVDEW